MSEEGKASHALRAARSVAYTVLTYCARRHVSPLTPHLPSLVGGYHLPSLRAAVKVHLQALSAE